MIGRRFDSRYSGHHGNMDSRYIQRSSIFRTQWKCRGKVYKVFISSGSITNIVSDEMLGKLNIEKITHITPYRVYGMNNDQWIDVKEQAYISFSIGSYCDTILCDAMPLGDFHIILGRVWQDDVRSLYDGSKNTYVINKNGKEFVMSSL